MKSLPWENKQMCSPCPCPRSTSAQGSLKLPKNPSALVFYGQQYAGASIAQPYPGDAHSKMSISCIYRPLLFFSITEQR